MGQLPAQLLPATPHVTFWIFNLAIPNIIAWATVLAIFAMSAWARMPKFLEPKSLVRIEVRDEPNTEGAVRYTRQYDA